MIMIKIISSPLVWIHIMLSLHIIIIIIQFNKQSIIINWLFIRHEIIISNFGVLWFNHKNIKISHKTTHSWWQQQRRLANKSEDFLSITQLNIQITLINRSLLNHRWYHYFIPLFKHHHHHQSCELNGCVNYGGSELMKK